MIKYAYQDWKGIFKLKHENKTIGILLCAGKNDGVVKFTLPENEKNIILSQYKIYP